MYAWVSAALHVTPLPGESDAREQLTYLPQKLSCRAAALFSEADSLLYLVVPCSTLEYCFLLGRRVRENYQTHTQVALSQLLLLLEAEVSSGPHWQAYSFQKDRPCAVRVPVEDDTQDCARVTSGVDMWVLYQKFLQHMRA